MASMACVDVLRLVVCLWITWTLLVIPRANGCYVNDCNCMRDQIVCESRDEPAPVFTPDERLSVRYLYISGVQSAWMSESCGLFSRLESVVMMDDTVCPEDSCVPCR
jgi:hypothetical protein